MIITEDHNYAIKITPRADPGQCHVDFRIWELMGEEIAIPVPIPLDMRGQWLTEESPSYCQGAVKWDGCVNFDFDDSGTMLHFCSMTDGPNSFDAFRDTLVYTYRLCALEMGDKWLDCIDELGGPK